MVLTLAPGTETSFVLTFFEEFYERVVAYKQQILHGHWNDLQEPLGEEKSHGSDAFPHSNTSLHSDTSQNPSGTSEPQPPSFPDPLESQTTSGDGVKAAQKILRDLKEILDRQSFDAPRFGGEFAAQYYREAQYIMVALADEVFLNLQWPGGDYWEEHLLESTFFGTHASGEIFFKRLDSFLMTQDPVRKDIAQLYLLTLGLGFLGQYRDKNDQGRLRAYKHQLYVFIYHQEPRLLEEDGEKLIPQAYAHTLKHGNPKALHDYKPWIVVYAALAGILTVMSLFVWHQSTRSLQTSVGKILAVKERLESRS